MYCKHCGKEIPDDSDVCMYCGASVGLKEASKQNEGSKTGVGFALGFFLGLIGLIIGFAIYPPETESRKTFLKGWWTGLLIELALAIMGVIIRACTMSVY